MAATANSDCLPARLRRGCAIASAALVMLLAILAASPAAHAALHHHDGEEHHAGGATGHVCAVVLFAGSVALPAADVGVAPAHARTQGVSLPAAVEIFLIAPRYLRQPERGPPGRD